MRLAPLLLVVVVVAGCAGRTVTSTGRAEAVPQADLEISVWRRGSDGPVRTRTLRCPSADTDCARLASLDKPFAPVPEGVACTQVYGGPQVARVVGTFRNDRLAAEFNRTDGCEIARWDRHAFLFPSG